MRSCPSRASARTISANWIDDGEKYAVVALNVKVEGQVPHIVAPNLWALANTTFRVPTDWRGWLGSIRVDEIENCNLFLLSKLRSSTPDILDAENQRLQQRVWNFYIGLLLTSGFSPSHKPVMLTGSRRNGEIGVRQQRNFDCPIPCLFHRYPPVTASDIRLAGQLGEKLDTLAASPPPGGPWRFFRALHVYTAARTTSEILGIGFTNTAAASTASSCLMSVRPSANSRARPNSSSDLVTTT